MFDAKNSDALQFQLCKKKKNEKEREGIKRDRKKERKKM